MNSGRITWPWIPIQIFGFPAILPWLPMSEGTQTEKNYLYSFCCGYYIKYSNHNKTVFAGPQLNFNCGPAKTVRIVTIRTIRNIGLTLFTATNRFTLAWRRGGDWRSNPQHKNFLKKKRLHFYNLHQTFKGWFTGYWVVSKYFKSQGIGRL